MRNELIDTVAALEGLSTLAASSIDGGELTGSQTTDLHLRHLLKSSTLKEEAKRPARLAIMLKVYSGMRAFRGGRADKKSAHAEPLMSSTAVSSPKRQLPLEMPPSAITRSQCGLTFLPNVPFLQSQTLLD